MLRITTAVDRRLGFGYEGCSTIKPPEFTKAAGLATRLEVFRQKLLKKALQIEQAELRFWVSELKRPQADFQTTRMLVQRIRTLSDGMPAEYLPTNLEDEISLAVHRHAVVCAKKKLANLKKEAPSGNYPYGETRADFLRFTRKYNVSLENLDYDKIQLQQLTNQASLAWNKHC